MDELNALESELKVLQLDKNRLLRTNEQLSKVMKVCSLHHIAVRASKQCFLLQIVERVSKEKNGWKSLVEEGRKVVSVIWLQRSADQQSARRLLSKCTDEQEGMKKEEQALRRMRIITPENP